MSERRLQRLSATSHVKNPPVPKPTLEDDAQPPTGNRIISNSIYDNDFLGIDLVFANDTAGVTKNDLAPPDNDTGPNNLQNFPGITSARLTPKLAWCQEYRACELDVEQGPLLARKGQRERCPVPSLQVFANRSLQQMPQ